MTAEFIPAAKPIIGDKERAAVDAVLKSGMVAQGPRVAEFEEKFTAQMASGDGQQSVMVNSGTSALHVGQLAAGIKPGDEVIVPSFTFAATGNSVAIIGATPVFADIEDDYFCLDPESIEASITPKTRAILPVHLYGHPANMTAIMDIAKRHNLLVFEDACQAHGATWNGQQVGTFGAFTTGDAELAREARMIRNQGMEKRYANELVGLNNRMTDINAAIGLAQLSQVADWMEKRRANAKFLNENLQGVKVPPVAPEAEHVYHQYTIRVSEDRDGFAAALKDEYQVGSGVYYSIPNHRLPSLAPYAKGLELPHTEKAAKECLSLPVHPSLSQGDLERIVEAVNKLAKAGA